MWTDLIFSDELVIEDTSTHPAKTTSQIRMYNTCSLRTIHCLGIDLSLGSIE